MADVAAPADTTSTAPATDSTVASPSPSSSAPSAPASTTAGDTAAATEGTSAREVWQEMQQKAAGGESPLPATSTDPSNAQPAIQADGTPEAVGESTPAKGPVPYDRHQAVITRTRNDTQRETLAEFGLTDVRPGDVKTAMTMFRALAENPRGFLAFVQSQLPQDGTTPAAATPPQAPADPEPTPDIELTDGRAVFSADQLRKWQQWHARQLTQQIDEKYGLLRDKHDQQVIAEAGTAQAINIVSHARENWPRFVKLEKHIRAALKADTRPMSPTTLYEHYIAADREHGTAMMRAEWDAERAGQLQRKAGASTIQPGMARPTTPRPDSELSSREIVQQEYRRAQAAG